MSRSSANAAKIRRILVDRDGHADLHRTAVGGPSGQRSDVLVGRVRYTWTDPYEFEVIATEGPFQGQRSGYAARRGQDWALWADHEGNGISYLGTATSLSLAVDIINSDAYTATGNHDHRRLSGGTYTPHHPLTRQDA